MRYIMKNHPLYLLTGFLLCTLCWLGCRDDTPSLFSTCPDGATYAVDYRSGVIEGGYIWLSEQDGDLAYEERLEPVLAPGPQDFFNFQDACEDQYTVSMAIFPNWAITEREIASDLRIVEFGAVPNGLLLDRTRNSLAGPNFIADGQIEIWNVPPVDQAQLLAPNEQYQELGYDLVFSHSNIVGDSLLSLVMNAGAPLNLEGMLVLHLADTEQAVGAYLDLRSFYPLVMFYNQFFPLEKRQLSVEWPGNSFDKELEVSWIKELNDKEQILLAAGSDLENVDVYTPLDATGPFVVKARWRGSADYEVQYVYDEWPSAITLEPLVEGKLTSFEYPELNFEVGFADILTLEGEDEWIFESEFGSRLFTTPVSAGVQSLRLPDFSPALTELGERLPALSQRTFAEDMQFSLWHFPAMNGSYEWYLRNVFSDLATGSLWLESLEYERLTVD